MLLPDYLACSCLCPSSTPSASSPPSLSSPFDKEKMILPSPQMCPHLVPPSQSPSHSTATFILPLHKPSGSGQLEG